MPSTAAGEYYSLFSDPSSGTTVEVAIFLLIWEFTILSALCGMMVYLTYFRNKIPIATLGNLQMACLLSICTTLALLSQFIDTSPPFLCWLSQWGSILLNLFLILLALERFKTFFVLSGHFSGSTVRLAQRAFIICYVICAASQYIILFRLGTRDYPAWWNFVGLFSGVTVLVDTGMNLYTLKFLHDYHIDQQEKFNTECKVFGIQQSPLRSLVVIYTLMAAIETVGVLLLATTILPAYHDRFGNHFRACVYNFGYSLMALHCFWVCLTFKLIQGLALSNKSSSPLQVPVVAMGRQVEISNGEMSTVRVGK